jgi:Peptidase family S41
MPGVRLLFWWYRAWLGVALALLSILTSACAGSPTGDPAKAELLR